jgi:hypothetical protein
VVTPEDDELAQLFADIVGQTRNIEDHRQAIHTVYQQLENAGLIAKVTVHRYHCKKCGHPLATAIRLGSGGKTLARTRDYKYSSGYNDAHSAKSARAQKTLDGNSHWPGHTYDIDELAAEEGHFEVVCRHVRKHILAADLLALTRDVRAGHPGKPTLL